MLFCGALCVCKTSRNTSVIPKWEEAKAQSRKEKVGAVEWSYPFKWGERYQAGLDTQRAPHWPLCLSCCHQMAAHAGPGTCYSICTWIWPDTGSQAPKFTAILSLFFYSAYLWLESGDTPIFFFVLLFQMNPAGEGTLLVKCDVVAQQHPRVLKQGCHSMPQHNG